MTQFVIGIVCSFWGIIGLRMQYNLYKRWPAMLENYEASIEEGNSEAIQMRYEKLKSTYTHVKPLKPFLWIGTIGLLLQGIYSLIMGLGAVL